MSELTLILMYACMHGGIILRLGVFIIETDHIQVLEQRSVFFLIHIKLIISDNKHISPKNLNIELSSFMKYARQNFQRYVSQ